MSGKFLLDTNILSPILRARKDNPAFIRFREEYSRSSTFYLCPVAYCEILAGLHHKDPGGLLERFEILQKNLIYVELHREDWEQAGKIRGQLQKKGITIHTPDALIAVQAARLKAIVVTDNEDDFKDTSNTVENWIRN